MHEGSPIQDGRTITDAHISKRPRKELTCRYCNNVYSRAEHLVRHERSTHTKERPFQCQYCEKDFSRRDTLLRHLRKMHKDLAPTTHATYVNTTHTPRAAAAGSLFSPEIIANAEEEAPASAARSTQQMDIKTLLRDERNPQIAAEVKMPGVARTVPVASISSEESEPVGRLLSQPWWLEPNLNLEVLDTPFFNFSGVDAPWFQAPSSDPKAGQENLTDGRLQEQIPTARSQRLADDAVQKEWFTHVTEVSPKDVHTDTAQSQRSLETNASHEVGHSIKAKVSQRPISQQDANPSPSTGLLIAALRSYCTTFSPLFPIVHCHTFKPSKENALLLIIMCSIGGMLIDGGSNSHCIKMFERFSKALLPSLDSALLSDSEEAIFVIQAALLGQVYGILSGDPKLLVAVEAFHGTIVAWARRCNMFRYQYQDLGQLHLSGLELDEAWSSWARSESALRTVLGIYLLDAHLAAVFHHDPLLRHDGIEIRGAADDEVFNSATATEWRDIMLQNPQSQTPLYRCLHVNQHHDLSLSRDEELSFKRSRFTGYFVLHSISSRISELQIRDQLQYGSRDFLQLSDALMWWYSAFEKHRHGEEGDENDTLHLSILWHTTFINLLTNFDKLERALGREGPVTPLLKDDISYALAWASSISADRCLLHAQSIQQPLMRMRLRDEPAIHTAHCAFLAGTASYSVMHFRGPSMRARFASTFPQSTPHAPFQFPEFNLRGTFSRDHLASVAPILFENYAGEQFLRTIDEPRMVYQVEADIFQRCVDVLQRMGHYRNARTYAGTLRALIQVKFKE